MKVVILCGGQGTRLREETEFKPKPMVDIGGYPVLWHIMKIYNHYGFNDFVLCLGHKGRMIKEYFLNYEAMNNDFTINLGRKNTIEFHNNHLEQDFKVTLVDTGEDVMTGARIKKIERYIDTDNFMVTYGDGVADININQLLKAHYRNKSVATVTTVRPMSRFGIVEIDEENHITNFAEKPRLDSWISAGFFVFNSKVFDYLSLDPSCTLEDGPLRQLTKECQLKSYRHDGFFYAMDTYREFLYLNNLWASGQAPWQIWENQPSTSKQPESVLGSMSNA